MLLDLFEQLSIQKKHLLFIESMKKLKIKKKILAEKRICWLTREENTTRYCEIGVCDWRNSLAKPHK